MNPLNSEISSLSKINASHPVIVGNRVFDVLPTTHELVDFTRAKYLLLQLLWRGASLEEAVTKTGLSEEEVLAFKESPKAKHYLQKKELASIMAEEAKDPNRWWATAQSVLEGSYTLNKGQMVVFQSVGDRVAPKKNESDLERSKTVINFNFSPEAVQEAFKRQESIEAELVREQNAL